MFKTAKKQRKSFILFITAMLISICNYGYANGAYAESNVNDFIWKTFEDSVSLIRYSGNNSTVSIPNVIQGRPVTSITGGYFASDIMNYSGAFESNPNIVSIDLPSNLKYIFNNAFANCTSLTSITIPSNVEYIDKKAFIGCTSLTSIHVDAKNPNFSSIDGILLDKSGNIYLYPPGNQQSSYTLPNTATTLSSDTFNNNLSLKTITIPSSVTSILKNNQGEDTFGSLTELANINVDAGNASFSSIQGVLFDKSGSKLLVYPKGKTETSYTIPNGVTKLEDAFNNKWLHSITFPSSLTTLRGFNRNITDITILGTSIPYLSQLTANNQDCKVTVHLSPKTSEDIQSSLINAGYIVTLDGILKKGLSGGLWWHSTGNAVTIEGCHFRESASYGYNNIKINSYPVNIPNLIAGKPVTKIGSRAFSDPYIGKVNLPNTVTTIGEEAFAGVFFSSLNIPTSVVSIDKRAFIDSRLVGLKLPYSVTAIGAEAFKNCKDLNQVVIENPFTSFEKNVFVGSSKNLTLFGYKGSTTEKYALSNKLKFSALSGYAVVFNSKGGSGVLPANVKNNAMLTKPATPTKEGFQFIDWYKDSKCTQTWDFDKDKVTANMTLYAGWR